MLCTAAINTSTHDKNTDRNNYPRIEITRAPSLGYLQFVVESFLAPRLAGRALLESCRDLRRSMRSLCKRGCAHTKQAEVDAARAPDG